jgi:hypothetical protein
MILILTGYPSARKGVYSGFGKGRGGREKDAKGKLRNCLHVPECCVCPAGEVFVHPYTISIGQVSMVFAIDALVL